MKVIATIFDAAHTRLDGAELDLWLHKAGVTIVAVEAEHADQARAAVVQGR